MLLFKKEAVQITMGFIAAESLDDYNGPFWF